MNPGICSKMHDAIVKQRLYSYGVVSATIVIYLSLLSVAAYWTDFLN